MNTLFNGYTRPVIDEGRWAANEALGRMMDALGAAEYLDWYQANIANKGLNYAQICQVVSEHFTECPCCADDRRCTCKPTNQEIPY
jgi:hypothetical protein